MKQSVSKPSKYNKKKCGNCKWHSLNTQDSDVLCYWAGYHSSTCLNRDGSDKRGSEYDNCLLFEEGVPESRIEPRIRRKR